MILIVKIIYAGYQLMGFMKKEIFIRIISMVLGILIISSLWEFLLEDIVMQFFDWHRIESSTEKWHVVITSLVFVIIAMIFPIVKAIGDEKNKRLINEKLELQNKFLETVINSFGYPFYVIDVKNHTIQMSNQKGKANSKGSKCYYISHNFSQPCEGCDHICPISEILETKLAGVVEHLHYNEQGQPVNVEVHAHPIFDSTGEVEKIIEYSIDITELKKEKTVQEVLYQISEAANSSININELYSLIHMSVKKVLKADNFYIARYDHGKGLISFPYFVDEFDEPPETRELKTGMTEYVLSSGESQLINPERYKELKKEKIIESIGEPPLDWIGIPLAIDDVKIGVMVIQSYSEKNRYGKAEKDLLEFVAAQVSSAINRVEAKEALKASEERYRLFVENASDFIYRTDLKGNILFINDTATKLFGYSDEELLGSNSFKYVPPEFQASLKRKYYSQFLNKSETTYYEIPVLGKNGHKIWLGQSVQLVFEGADIIGFQVIARDITELIIARDKVNNYIEELKVTNSNKDKLFSIISHDLKSPFHATLALSEHLSDEANSLEKEDIIEYSSLIHKELKNQYRLLEAVLNWSRLQLGKMNFEPERFDLENLASEVIQSLKTKSTQKDIKLTLNIPSSCYVKADINMMRSVLHNLISNAIKFTKTNGEVIIKHQESPEYHSVSVVDDGIGMEKNLVDKIFENDSIITTNGTSGEKGTGLGLMLCKEMIEKHNGEIWVESELEKGSNFKFTIPSDNNTEL